MTVFHPVHDAMFITRRKSGMHVVVHKLSGRTYRFAFFEHADAEAARTKLINTWTLSVLNTEFIKNADDCLRR
jgi:hypothetical protein